MFQRAVEFILSEIIDGPRAGEAYLLNPGDPGIVNQLARIDAETASKRPMEGLTTVASHTAHVLYGFNLCNRWAAGEENPWKDADWGAAWQQTEVNDVEWESLKASFTDALQSWRSAFAQRREWNEIEARGAAEIAAHLAYHLGAIRQILAAMNRNDTPK